MVINECVMRLVTKTLMLSDVVCFEGHILGSIDLSEDGTRSSVTTNPDLNDR